MVVNLLHKLHDGECPVEGGRDASSSRKRSRTTQPEENVDRTGGDGAAEHGLIDTILTSIEGSAEGAANEQTVLHGSNGASEQSSRKRARLAEDNARVSVDACESGRQAPAAQVVPSVIILEDSDDEGSEFEKYPPVITLEDSDDEGSGMGWSRTDVYAQLGNVDAIGGDGAHGGAGGIQSMVEGCAGGAADGSLDLQQEGDGGSQQGSSTEVENVQDQGQPAVPNLSSDRPAESYNEESSWGERATRRFESKFCGILQALSSDKTFVTLDDVWYGFNLFSIVHESVPSYTKITSKETKLKIDVEASHWSQFHHVALLAHLRLKGRGKYPGKKLPSLRGISKYRNVKPRWTKRGTKWDCDVMLPEGMKDPNVAKSMKKQLTFVGMVDSSHEAAKEADILIYLREGNMAWTNFALIDCMSDIDEKKLPKTWLPLQDNPKKYLTNHRSFEFTINNS